MSETTLKPCPFCGPRSDLVINDYGQNPRLHYVKCKRCVLQTKMLEDKTKLISYWNFRPEVYQVVTKTVVRNKPEVKIELDKNI